MNMQSELQRKKAFAIIVITALSCAVMALIDGIVSPPYFAKSLCKIALFGIMPVFYAVIFKEKKLGDVFKPKAKGMFFSLLLGGGVYAVIVGGYFLLKDVFDFSAVTKSLTSGEGVTKDNFIYVALYISFCNSLLEEFFFRGFAFLRLKNSASRQFAYIFSSLSFSLYHVAFMAGWFEAPLFILLLVGLFAGGMIFNCLDEKTGSIYPSWIFHMFANFATNTVGIILFYSK